MKIRIYQIALAAIALTLTSCEGYLEALDSSILTPEEVTEVLNTHDKSLVEGIYATAQYDYTSHDRYGTKALHTFADLMSEDMVMHYSTWFIYDYRMMYTPANYTRTSYIWNHCYGQIRSCNTIIDLYSGIDEADLLTSQKNIIGEALALRAYYYFHLINFYQFAGEWDNIKDMAGVPLSVSSAIQSLPRSTVAEVYEQMMEDASTAVEYLNGVNPGASYIGETAAKLIYARIALYKGEYEIAQAQAADVVSATTLMPTNQYTVYAETDGVYSHGDDGDLWSGYFDKISNIEWVWGVEVTSLNASSYASFSSHFDSYTNDGYAIDSEKCIDRQLYNTMLDNDVRAYAFNIDYGTEDNEISLHQRKFVDGEGGFRMDYVYLRAAEAHYIKAEAEARTGDIAAAQASLDLISNARAIDGAHGYVWESSADDLIDQIFNHKRVEMWGEGLSLFEFNRLEKPINRFYEGSNHPIGYLYYGDIVVEYGDGIRRMQLPQAELTANEYINDEDQNSLR